MLESIRGTPIHLRSILSRVSLISAPAGIRTPHGGEGDTPVRPTRASGWLRLAASAALLALPLIARADCSYDLNGVGYGDTCANENSQGSGGYQPPAVINNNNYYYQQQMLMRQRMIEQQELAQQRLEQQQLLEEEQRQKEAEERKEQEEAARRAKFLFERNAAASELKGGAGFDSAGPGGSLGGLKTGEDAGPFLKTGGCRDYGSGVVNACGVKSGLPKSVEDSIPHTPAGDRVRKGYEAVMHHDWKVALAWFEDAHNHDPHNAGIERLVDLARYTLEQEEKASLTPKEQHNDLKRILDLMRSNTFQQDFEKNEPATVTSVRG